VTLEPEKNWKQSGDMHNVFSSSLYIPCKTSDSNFLMFNVSIRLWITFWRWLRKYKLVTWLHRNCTWLAFNTVSCRILLCPNSYCQRTVRSKTMISNCHW